MVKMASYDSDVFKVTEIISTTHSTASVCLFRLQGYMLIHLLAMGVAETPELNN